MEGSNATIAMGEMCIIGFQIGKITHEDVKYSWMYSRAGFHGNSGRESLNPSSASTDEMIAVVDEIRPTLAGPFQRLLAADRIRNDDLYHWPMRSLRVPQQLLNRSIDSNVVFIGDAVHAMPIFAGEGGNHGLLDGVQLAECLRVGVQHNHLKESIQQFYDDAYGRWEKGVDASEKRLSDLHQPIEVWRKLAAVEVSK